MREEDCVKLIVDISAKMVAAKCTIGDAMFILPGLPLS